MKKKRDLLNEIKAKKERSEFDPMPSIELFSLRIDFDERLEMKETSRHATGLFVVGIVACIEVAIRYAIRRLIDHGRPYIERISEFKETLPLDFNIAIALHDKRVTFGDLVSHLLPVSSIEQINSHFGILFGREFKQILTEVKEFVEPEFTEPEESPVETESEEEAEPPLLPIPDVNALIASLGRLFSARHSAAHEAAFYSVTNDELLQFFKTGEIFIHALDEMVRQIIEPDLPRFAPGMAIFAVQEAEKVAAEMEVLYEKATVLATNARSRFGYTDTLTQAEALKNSQDAFEKYFDAEMACRGIYSSTLSGSGMRARDAHVQKELCAHRIQMLAELISDLEFDAEISSLTKD
jgi:hypothetical protein